MSGSLGEGGARVWDTGTGLAGYRWPAATPRGVLLLQHGLSEYAERYVHAYRRLVPALQRLGLDVYAIDLEGHGRSPGRRADTTVERAVMAHRAARAHLPEGRPRFLFGHSLGGLVTVLSVLEDPDAVAGVILSSPALGIPASPLQVAAVRLLAPLLPTLPVGRLDLGGLSHRPDLVAEAAADPKRYHGGIRARMAASLLAATREVRARRARWTTPVWVVHGTDDPYTRVEASEAFVAAIPAADKTLHLVHAGRHELLNDDAADTVLAELLGWLAARLPST